MAVQISGNDITVPRDGSFTRNVTIGGTLTYEDVTNIDSVGLVTARTGIEIGARPGVAASISVDGNMIVSGISTFGGALSGTTGTFSGAVSGSTGTFTGDVDIADKIVHTGDTNTAIRFPSADTFTVETGGSEGLKVDANGTTVTTTTDASLFVNTTNSNGGHIRLQTSGTNKTFLGQAAGISGSLGGADDFAIRSAEDIVFSTNDNNTLNLKIDTSGRLGIQGAATKGVLDVRASGGSATMLTAVFGANEGQTGGTLSDNADKACRIGSYHYDTDEEPFGILVASGTNGANTLNFGGGTSLMNAATRIQFTTAANSTTTSGTTRLLINSEGQLFKAQDPVNRTSLKTFTGEGLWIDHYQLQDSGTYRRYTDIASIGDGSWGGIIRFLTMADGGSSVERLRLTQNNIFTNSQTPNAPSSGSGWGFTQDQLYLSTNGTSANYALRFYNDNGLVGSALVNGSSTTYNTSSDYRLKENQVSISDGITRLKQLKPYRFNFKADTSTTLDGFFAHEAQSVVPEAVTGTKDQVANADDVTDGLASAVGDAVYQGIDHSKFVPLLTASLQEAISEIETLKTEVAALKSQLNN